MSLGSAENLSSSNSVPQQDNSVGAFSCGGEKNQENSTGVGANMKPRSRESMTRAEVEVAMLVKTSPKVNVLSPLEVKTPHPKAEKKYTVSLEQMPNGANGTEDNTTDSTFKKSQRTSRPRKTHSISVNRLESISKLLVKNAQFKHNGPGLPTSIAVHSKFWRLGHLIH